MSGILSAGVTGAPCLAAQAHDAPGRHPLPRQFLSLSGKRRLDSGGQN